MASQENYDPRVDAYIEKAKPFAQPILGHIRELVHQACPGANETIKWGMPFFEYKGAIVAHVAAFKEHCSFGFWDPKIRRVVKDAKAGEPSAMGSLGRITRLEDLPPKKQLMGLLKEAAGFIDSGEYTSPIAARNKAAKAPKAAIETPLEFQKALKANKKAGTAFAAMSPSCKREYVEWIADAKRDETREKRIATAIEWISEGKRRNWKYE